MNQTIAIRRAEEKDTARILDLLRQVNNVHHDGRPDLFKKDCRKYTTAELGCLIADDTHPIFVAQIDAGFVAGYAFCVMTEYRGDNNQVDRKSLYIDDLCVDETCRGQGIGRALFDYVKAWAKGEGVYNITLNVWACNQSAVRFYEKCGLTVQKTTLETIL